LTYNRDPVLKPALAQRSCAAVLEAAVHEEKTPNKRKFSRPKTKLGLPDLDQSTDISAIAGDKAHVLVLGSNGSSAADSLDYVRTEVKRAIMMAGIASECWAI